MPGTELIDRSSELEIVDASLGRIKVTDAGDREKGATVKVGGKTATTGRSGVAQFAFGPAGATESIRVTAPSYRAYSGHVSL